MTDRIAKTQFESAVNSDFASQDDPGISFNLVRIQEGRSTDKIEQFSLIFRGPAQPALKQGTRRLLHPVLGEVDLFLVPVGATPGGIDYEAAFTRFLEKR